MRTPAGNPGRRSWAAGTCVALAFALGLWVVPLAAGAATPANSVGLPNFEVAAALRPGVEAVLARQTESLLIPPALRSLLASPRLKASPEVELATAAFRLIQGVGGSADAYAELGRLNLALGRWDEARTALDAALTREPRHVRALVARGLLAALTGDALRVDESLSRAEGVAPSDREVRLLSAAWALAQGRDASAGLAALGGLTSDRAPSVAALTIYGAALEAADRPVEARDVLTRATTLDPRDAIALDLLANLDFDARDWSRAAASWAKALEVEPGFHPARLGLAQAYWRAARHSEALGALDINRRQYDEGHLSVALTLSALIGRETGLFREAALNSGAALQLDPENGLARGLTGSPQYSSAQSPPAVSSEEAAALLRKLRPGWVPGGQATGLPGLSRAEYPAGQLVIGNGNPYTNQSRTTVRVQSTDPQELIGFWLVPSGGASEWRRAGLGPVALDLGPYEGSQEIKAYLVGRRGWHRLVTATVTVDRTPPVAYLSINSGLRVTANPVLSLSLYPVDPVGPVTSMSFSEDGGFWSGWEPVAYVKEYRLTGGDGQRNIQVRFMDQAGNIGEPAGASILLDMTPPQVYGVRVTNIDFRSARLAWATSKPAVSRLEVSPGEPTISGELEGAASTLHEVELNGLRPGTSYLVRIFATDGSGNAGLPAEATFRTRSDNSAPSGGLTINSGERYVTSARVYLHPWAYDRDSGVEAYRLSIDGFFWNEWRPFANLIDFQLPGGEGRKVVYIQYRDEAGNVSEVYQASVVLDATRLRISNVSATQIAGTSALIVWSTNEPATSFVNVRGVGGRGYRDDNQVYEHRVSITGLTPGTDYTYEVSSRDEAGEEESSGTYRFRTAPAPDTTPPRVRFVINNGAFTTPDPEVMLSISATDNSGGPMTMAFSNDRRAWSRWEPVTPTKVWRLEAREGAKTVYGRFRDQAGNEAEVSASIRLEGRGPVITDARASSVTADSAVLTWKTAPATRGTVTITSRVQTWSVNEDREGLDHRVVLSHLTPQTTYSWTVRAIDAAGRAVTAGPFELTTAGAPDVTPPQGRLTINRGAPSTNSLDVTLYLEVRDNRSASLSMCFSNDQTSWSRWEPLAPTKAWRLMPPSGAKTVYARFRDDRGNESSANASIRLDLPGPRILRAGVERITDRSAFLVWQTDMPTTGRVTLSGGGDRRTLEETSNSTSHRVELERLRPQTTYTWTLLVRDASGATTSYNGESFTTQGSVPPSPPPPSNPPSHPAPPPHPPLPPSQPPSPPPAQKPVNVGLMANGARAAASSADQGHQAEAAVDGNAKSYWEPRAMGEAWLEVRLAKAYRVDAVRLSGELERAEARIQYEVGGKWVDLAVWKAGQGVVSVDVKNATTSRLRILVQPAGKDAPPGPPARRDPKSDKDEARVRVAEFEVWATP